jgi:predicted amidophosphoribosyltransferase
LASFAVRGMHSDSQVTDAGVACAGCGFELAPIGKFCLECGTPIAAPERSAEYQQVTVVHSMDIAAAV